MAHIVVVTHEFDHFAYRRHFWSKQHSDYLLFEILRAVERYGHTWAVTSGPSVRSHHGDVGILHVDSTQVSDDYRSLGRNFELPINFAVSDVSKRAISGARLLRQSDWTGQVIIKSNLNYMGHPEARQNHAAAQRRQSSPHPGLSPVESYLILPSSDRVPHAVWDDESRVVERFIPEPAIQGFTLRSWVFMGPEERCVRHISHEPIVKPAGVVSSALADVPNSLREQRTRMGFEFGKFDFVLHEGGAVLLHANRTPPASSALGPTLNQHSDRLAEGLDHLITTTVARRSQSEAASYAETKLKKSVRIWMMEASRRAARSITAAAARGSQLHAPRDPGGADPEEWISNDPAPRPRPPPPT